MARSMSSVTFLGSKETVRQQLTTFQERYNVDEIMAVSYIYDPDKQKRSYEILKEVVRASRFLIANFPAKICTEGWIG